MSKPRNQGLYTLAGYGILVLGLLLAAWIIGEAFTGLLDAGISHTGFMYFGCSPILFGILIGRTKRHWRNKNFWLALSFAFILHTAVYFAVVPYMEDWDAREYTGLIVVEGAFLLLAVRRATEYLSRELG